MTEELEYQIKDLIKEMLKNGEIKINVKTEADYYGTNIATRVFIDDEEVYKEEESLKIF
jgi:hypothetical protein